MTVYDCPGIDAPQPPDAPSEGYVACYRAGHKCPPKVPLTVDEADYRSVTYRCPCCGDYGVSYGGPLDWFTSPSDASTSHGARVLRGGGRAWVECLCGWTSGDYRSAAAVSHAWAEHVRLSETATRGGCDA